MAEQILTSDRVHEIIMQLWHYFDPLINSTSAEELWADEYHVGYPLAETMLREPKRQYLSLIRDRLMTMQQQPWTKAEDLYEHVPQAYDPVENFLDWLNEHGDLINYAALTQELRQQFIDNYRELAAADDNYSWWISNQYAVLNWFNTRNGVAPATKLEALAAIDRGDSLENITAILGGFSKEDVHADKANRVSYEKLVQDAYQILVAAQYVNQIVATTLLDKFAKYAADAQAQFDDLIDSTNHLLAAQVATIYYPHGIDDPEAPAIEANFLEQHITLPYVKSTGLTESWVMSNCEQLGAIDPIKTHLIENLNADAESIIGSLYEPDVAKELTTKVDFSNAVGNANAQELSNLIFLYAASGVVGVARSVNEGVDILEGNAETPLADASFALSTMTQQQGLDWDNALNLVTSHYGLDDYSDEIETDLYPLSEQLNTELGAWLGQHADEIKHISTMSELNRLLVQYQPQFLNANIIANRMIQNRNWSSLRASFIIRFDARFAVMDVDTLVVKLIDDDETFDNYNQGDLAHSISDALQSDAFEPDIKAYVDGLASFDDFSNALNMTDEEMFDALGPSAWVRLKMEVERRLGDD